MNKLQRYKRNTIKQRFKSLCDVLQDKDFQDEWVKALWYKAYRLGNTNVLTLKKVPQQPYITNTDVCNID